MAFKEPNVVICPYCEKRADVATGRDVYPNQTGLKNLKFYVCLDCDARVGCHKNSGKPFGTLANADLRIARSQAHRVFDPKWRNGDMTRKQAYAWLADKMDIHVADCHISHFGEWQCQEVVAVCQN